MAPNNTIPHLHEAQSVMFICICGRKNLFRRFRQQHLNTTGNGRRGRKNLSFININRSKQTNKNHCIDTKKQKLAVLKTSFGCQVISGNLHTHTHTKNNKHRSVGQNAAAASPKSTRLESRRSAWRGSWMLNVSAPGGVRCLCDSVAGQATLSRPVGVFTRTEHAADALRV